MQKGCQRQSTNDHDFSLDPVRKNGDDDVVGESSAEDMLVHVVFPAQIIHYRFQELRTKVREVSAQEKMPKCGQEEESTLAGEQANESWQTEPAGTATVQAC